ncbi:MAG: DUF6088 family protein [Chloroflexi bacterium]|nr:DUF6088 family protein [Chloroflexota bacterium]MCY3695897.1 DUF6088 family protein [Chloroflexota bacterium]
MASVGKALEQHVSNLPEGEVVQAKAFLRLGKRATVDKALSRLADKGRLQRACQGVYVAPVETRFGRRAPAADKVVRSLSQHRGEQVASSGGAAANALGLTTQVPVQQVYLTAGPDRTLRLGELAVELRHAPRWQLLAPERKAGQVIRALAWLGPEEAATSVERLQSQLTAEERQELSELSATLPSWLAELLHGLVGDD